MNILYKYCDPHGIEKILETLELKLPFISDVNDPFECLPVFHCPDDRERIEERYIAALKRKNMMPYPDYQQILNQSLENGKIRNILKESALICQREVNQQSCLLSVSKNAQEAVMWAHYTKMHEGGVIGIDFNCLFPNGLGPEIHQVNYSKDRPVINILEEPETGISFEAFAKAVTTKSESWKYEEEFRVIFPLESLNELRHNGIAIIKNFKGKDTWFLKLNPTSIREVIFGLYTDDSLKTTIKKLIEQFELQHVLLYDVEKPETYNFNLKEHK